MTLVKVFVGHSCNCFQMAPYFYTKMPNGAQICKHNCYLQYTVLGLMTTKMTTMLTGHSQWSLHCTGFKIGPLGLRQLELLNYWSTLNLNMPFIQTNFKVSLSFSIWDRISNIFPMNHLLQADTWTRFKLNHPNPTTAGTAAPTVGFTRPRTGWHFLAAYSQTYNVQVLSKWKPPGEDLSDH